MSGPWEDYSTESGPWADYVKDDAVKPAEFTAGVLRKFKQGASLGFGDELSGALKATFGGRGAEGKSWSERYDNARNYERSAYDKAGARTGVFGSAAELLGSIAPSIGAGEIVGAAGAARVAAPAARALLPASGEASSALPALRNAFPAASRAVPNPLAEAMATGSLTGSVQSVGDTEDKMDAPLAAVKGAVVGSLGGAAGYGAGRGLERLARFTNTAPRVSQAPTTDAIRAQAQEAYDRFTNAGGLFTQTGLNDLSGAIRGRLTEMGWQPELGPKVQAFNRAMERARMGSGVPNGAEGLNQTATPAQIQNLRRVAGKVADSNDPTERAYGSAIIDEIDNFLGNVHANPEHYAALPGAATNISDDLAEGNRLWTQYSKASTVEDALGRAERRAASTYSGGNENNAMRQEMRRIYERMLRRGGLSEDERAAFETAIRGGRTENIARLMGKLAPSRGGLSTWANIGAGAGTGGATLPITALAEGMKVLGDRATRRNLDEVSRVIRAGGRRRSVEPAPNAVERGAEYLPWLLSGPGGAGSVRGLLD
jgi:hypothetical protein